MITGILLLAFIDYKTLFSGNNFGMVILFALQWIIALVPLLIFTRYKYKLRSAHFGFEKIGVRRMLGLVLTAYLLYLGISIVISALILYYDLQIPGYQIQKRILPLFGDDTFSLIVAGVVMTGLAPVLEEVFFRGFLLRTIVNRVGVVLGSIITAVIFSLLHVPWQSFIQVFILGLIINSIVIRGKSLWPAICFHSFNNAIAFIIEILILKDVISIEKLGV